MKEHFILLHLYYYFMQVSPTQLNGYNGRIQMCVVLFCSYHFLLCLHAVGVLVLYGYINVLYYYINVCLWKRKKERKDRRRRKKERKRDTLLSVGGCMYAYKIGVCMNVGRHVGFSPTKGHVFQ